VGRPFTLRSVSVPLECRRQSLRHSARSIRRNGFRASWAGAGDATVGALAAELARGLDVREAAKIALEVGRLTVRDIGPIALGFKLGNRPTMS
jgi:hydroxymethylpyrimidine/phosphomethylpyrimidine kinase